MKRSTPDEQAQVIALVWMNVCGDIELASMLSNPDLRGPTIDSLHVQYAKRKSDGSPVLPEFQAS